MTAMPTTIPSGIPKKLRSQVNDLPAKRLAGIGRVAAELVEFEGSVETMIWRLAGLTNPVLAACITSHMDLPKKLDALLELAREVHPGTDIMKHLIAVDRTLRPATTWERNLIGPAIWSLDGALARASTESKMPTRKAAKRSHRKYASEVGLVAKDGLAEIADRLASATHRLRVVFAIMIKKNMPEGWHPAPRKAKKKKPKKKKGGKAKRGKAKGKKTKGGK